MKIYRIAGKSPQARARDRGDIYQWRNYAHYFFDKLWMKPPIGHGSFTRDEAYRAMSEVLKIPYEQAHIGMFNVEQCKRVSDWAKQTIQALDDIDKEFNVKIRTRDFKR